MKKDLKLAQDVQAKLSSLYLNVSVDMYDGIMVLIAIKDNLNLRNQFFISNLVESFTDKCLELIANGYKTPVATYQTPVMWK